MQRAPAVGKAGDQCPEFTDRLGVPLGLGQPPGTSAPRVQGDLTSLPVTALSIDDELLEEAQGLLCAAGLSRRTRPAPRG